MSETLGGKPLEIPNSAVQVIRDLPRSTRIRVYRNKDVLEGQISSVIETLPGSTGGALVELVNTIVLSGPPGNTHYWLGFSRVELDDIKCFQRVEHPRSLENPIQKTPTEICYSSVVINTDKSFAKMLNLLLDVNEVALSFHGVNLGRDGKVAWIVLYACRTIILLDVIKLVQVSPHFWDTIYSELLGKKEVTKVVFNSRPMVDYLYFNHRWTMNNIFDCQVAEYSLQSKEGSKAGVKHFTSVYKPLSQCLQTYLGYEVLGLEIKLLREVEGMDFSQSSPLMSRPVTDEKVCKGVAIGIKYLLCLKRELTNKMLDGYYRDMSTGMEKMIKGNPSAKEHFAKVPTTIPMTVVKALSPSGDSNKSKHGDFPNVPKFSGTHNAKDKEPLFAKRHQAKK